MPVRCHQRTWTFCSRQTKCLSYDSSAETSNSVFISSNCDMMPTRFQRPLTYEKSLSYSVDDQLDVFVLATRFCRNPRFPGRPTFGATLRHARSRPVWRRNDSELSPAGNREDRG